MSTPNVKGAPGEGGRSGSGRGDGRFSTAPTGANAQRAVRSALERLGLAGGAGFVHGQVVDQRSGRPIRNAMFEVVDGQGHVVSKGRTDYTGIVSTQVGGSGSYQIRVIESPPREPEV